LAIREEFKFVEGAREMPEIISAYKYRHPGERAIGAVKCTCKAAGRCHERQPWEGQEDEGGGARIWQSV